MGDTQERASYALPEPPTPGGTSGGSSVGREEHSQERPKRAKRSFLTQNACTRCRSKKSKCDGARPVCERCRKHGAECIYDVAQEGLTRMQNLQQQLEARTADHGRLQNLFSLLQNGTDQEATSLLARMRMGAGVDELLSVAQPSPMSSMSLPDGPSTHQSFPREQQQPGGYMQQQYTTSPASDQGGWEQWPQAGSRSMSMSSESHQEGFQPSAGMALQGYYAPQEPYDPYYHQMPGEGYGSHEQQWQGNQSSEIAMPPGYQFATPQGPFGAQQQPPPQGQQQGQPPGEQRGGPQPPRGRSRT
ncbi:uncharacterized protein LTR77_005946 [Saxophila tyrrhenica]|uniref:Zn(2)-C6 fungal-type domain-containing protein n=1 Tax=Saxophila tyrrhenica TaxID=1690608 RepID=A0AAV9P9I2_9PEZI|nr:hypothetical protein LTR77_005946 [Saxophila tyrrhenica]